MKNVNLFIVLLAVIFTSILCIPNDVYARAEFSFDEIKIVNSYGSIIGQDEFGFNETHWLYMKMSKPGQVTTESSWNLDVVVWNTTTTGPNEERWITLSDWNSNKVGAWDVTSTYLYPNGNTGSDTTSFTVSPEPISMILFLFGGMSLAASLYRKKKKALKV